MDKFNKKKWRSRCLRSIEITSNAEADILINWSAPGAVTIQEAEMFLDVLKFRIETAKAFKKYNRKPRSVTKRILYHRQVSVLNNLTGMAR